MKLNPLEAVDYFINKIENENDGKIIKSSPLQSFIEATASTNLEFASFIERNKAKRFPYLAKNMDDLTHHITDEDEKGLFATPAKTRIRFFISVQDILNHGILKDDVYTAILPKYTKVKIDDLVFLLETPIRITLKKENRYYSFVERINIEGDEVTSIGVLKSAVTTSGEIEWLAFEDELIQTDLEIYEYPVVLNDQLDIRIPLNDNQYYTSKLYMRFDGVTSPVRKVYNASVIEDAPMALTIPKDNEVVYAIPPALVHKNIIRGTLIIYLYTTKGKIRRNLNNRTDFKIVLPSNFNRPEEAVIDSMDIFALSPYIVDGGNDKRVFRDIKKKIINRTTGEFDRPIAYTELVESARLRGFSITPIERNIISRTYAAHKETPPGISNIFNTDTFIDNYKKYKGIIFKDDYTIINSNTIVIDGEPITPEEYNRLQNIEYLKETIGKKIVLFTPFRYILDKLDGYRDTRAYYTKVKIDDLAIIDKNREVPVNVNIDDMDIEIINETDEDIEYKISLKLIGNDKYQQLFDNNGLLGQLVIKLANSNDDVTQRIDLAKEDNKLVGLLKVDKYIDRKNRVKIYSGANEAGIEAYMNIDSEVYVVLYTRPDLSSTVMEPNENMYIYLKTGFKPLPIYNANIGISRQKFRLTLAKHLDNLWTYSKELYLGRKQKTYDTDVYAKYEEDVYQRDPVSGCEIIPIWNEDTSQCLDAQIIKIHNKGDYILDENGNKIIQHRKGEPVFIDGKPAFEDKDNIATVISLLLLEYGYLAINRSEYDKLEETIELIAQWVTYDIPKIKDKLIERTNLLLLSPRDIGKHVIDRHNKLYDSLISPKVKVYIRDSIDDNTKENIKSVIIAVLEKYFAKAYISLDQMEKEIRDKTNIESVLVYGHTKDNDRVIDIKTNRFTIKKIITNDLKYVPDIKIDIITI